MAAPKEHNPFDIEGNLARDEERQARERIALETSRGDLAWQLSGKRGRRIIRRQLHEAGIFAGQISSTFNSNFGLMCFSEGLRASALKTLAGITELLVSGGISLEDYKLLWTEKDE